MATATAAALCPFLRAKSVLLPANVWERPSGGAPVPALAFVPNAAAVMDKRRFEWAPAFTGARCMFDGAAAPEVVAAARPYNLVSSEIRDHYLNLKTEQRDAWLRGDATLAFRLDPAAVRGGLFALFLAAMHVHLDAAQLDEPADRPCPVFVLGLSERPQLALLCTMLDTENPLIETAAFSDVRAIRDWYASLR